MWNPDSGTSPNRSFVLGSEDLFNHFHKRRREIDKQWPACTAADDVEIIRMMREASHEDLREEVRHAAKLGFTGTYLIPV